METLGELQVQPPQKFQKASEASEAQQQQNMQHPEKDRKALRTQLWVGGCCEIGN